MSKKPTRQKRLNQDPQLHLVAAKHEHNHQHQLTISPFLSASELEKINEIIKT